MCDAPKQRQNSLRLRDQFLAAREATILHVQHHTPTRIQGAPFSAENDRKTPSRVLRGNRAAAGSADLPGPVGGSRPEDATALTDADFKAQLVHLIPHLRAFARSLLLGEGGDDLAQDAILRAWKSRVHFQAGTNLKAWVFTILRNQFLSDKRRSWRSLPLDPLVAEQTLVAHDDPSSREELLDVRGAMRLLPDEQREALILVGAAGMSYDEAAQIIGCPVGTIKSRVSRARAMLVQILEGRATGARVKVDVEATQVFNVMMDEAGVLRRELETNSRKV